MLNPSQVLAGADPLGPHLKGNKELREMGVLPAALKVVSVEGVLTDSRGLGVWWDLSGLYSRQINYCLSSPNRM